MLGLAGLQGADLRRSLLSDVRLVLGEHLKTSHVHPAADVETAAQEEILGRSVPTRASPLALRREPWAEKNARSCRPTGC